MRKWRSRHGARGRRLAVANLHRPVADAVVQVVWYVGLEPCSWSVALPWPADLDPTTASAEGVLVTSLLLARVNGWFGFVEKLTVVAFVQVAARLVQKSGRSLRVVEIVGGGNVGRP